jgi:hypothetical protein
MPDTRELHICCDDSNIGSLIFIDLPYEPTRIYTSPTNLRYFAMSDHHIESIAIWHRPLIFVSDRRIMYGSLFGYLETKKARSLTSIEIFDHTDSELVSIFFVDGCLCESPPSLTVTDTDPFGMCGVDDELVFDLEIGGHKKLQGLLKLDYIVFLGKKQEHIE